jgi:hypothetical protein
MIVFKELKTCPHGLHQNVEALCDHTVNLYQDNQVVCRALRKMSSKCPALMSEIKDLVPCLHENKIHLDVTYIRNEGNLTDVPSHQRDLDMWFLQQSTQQAFLDLVESTLGLQVCTNPSDDRQSAVAPRFTTPLHCRHSAAFNGLFLDW